MHTKDPLPLPKQRRPRPRQIATRASASHPLLRLSNIYPRPDSDECLPSRSHTRHRYWRQHAQLESYSTTHTMPQLRAHGDSSHHVRLHWCNAATDLRAPERTSRRRQVSIGSILCSPREVTVHRSASAQATRSTRRCPGRRATSPHPRQRRSISRQSCRTRVKVRGDGSLQHLQ